jgi:hypothetical protein
MHYQDWKGAVKWANGIGGTPEILIVGDIGAEEVPRLFTALAGRHLLPDIRPGNVAQNQETFDAIEHAIELWYGNIYDSEWA